MNPDPTPPSQVPPDPMRSRRVLVEALLEEAGRLVDLDLMAEADLRIAFDRVVADHGGAS